DRAFVEALRKGLKQEIRLIEVDANMEDPEFARAVVKEALEIL
ncbi:MAG: Tm-1-like ATP-binding domain-containing protein, partial [Deltaproteobacteria bacterium]|nr:Tm-1-like ATP-binding domain-containing protein [Deltaproteobacteria bacterium]